MAFYTPTKIQQVSTPRMPVNGQSAMASRAIGDLTGQLIKSVSKRQDDIRADKLDADRADRQKVLDDRYQAALNLEAERYGDRMARQKIEDAHQKTVRERQKSAWEQQDSDRQAKQMYYDGLGEGLQDQGGFITDAMSGDKGRKIIADMAFSPTDSKAEHDKKALLQSRFSDKVNSNFDAGLTPKEARVDQLKRIMQNVKQKGYHVPGELVSAIDATERANLTARTAGIASVDSDIAALKAAMNKNNLAAAKAGDKQVSGGDGSSSRGNGATINIKKSVEDYMKRKDITDEKKRTAMLTAAADKMAELVSKGYSKDIAMAAVDGSFTNSSSSWMGLFGEDTAGVKIDTELLNAVTKLQRSGAGGTGTSGGGGGTTTAGQRKILKQQYDTMNSQLAGLLAKKSALQSNPKTLRREKVLKDLGFGATADAVGRPAIKTGVKPKGGSGSNNAPGIDYNKKLDDKQMRDDFRGRFQDVLSGKGRGAAIDLLSSSAKFLDGIGADTKYYREALKKPADADLVAIKEASLGRGLAKEAVKTKEEAYRKERLAEQKTKARAADVDVLIRQLHNKGRFALGTGEMELLLSLPENERKKLLPLLKPTEQDKLVKLLN